MMLIMRLITVVLAVISMMVTEKEQKPKGESWSSSGVACCVRVVLMTEQEAKEWHPGTAGPPGPAAQPEALPTISTVTLRPMSGCPKLSLGVQPTFRRLLPSRVGLRFLETLA